MPLRTPPRSSLASLAVVVRAAFSIAALVAVVVVGMDAWQALARLLLLVVDCPPIERTRARVEVEMEVEANPLLSSLRAPRMSHHRRARSVSIAA